MSKFKFNHRSQKPIGQHVREHGNLVLNSRAAKEKGMIVHSNGAVMPDSADKFIATRRGATKRGWNWSPPIPGARRFVVETVSRGRLHAPIVRVEEEFEPDQEKRLKNLAVDLALELSAKEAEIARFGGVQPQC